MMTYFRNDDLCLKCTATVLLSPSLSLLHGIIIVPLTQTTFILISLFFFLRKIFIY